MRILIVDDNIELLHSLKRVLELAGYAVDVASNGREAFSKQRRQPAEVLVTDIVMPEWDGLETIASFRAAFPDTRIVAMSGREHTHLRNDYLPVAQAAGADRILRKPFAPETLLEALKSL